MKLLKSNLINLHPNEYNQELHYHPCAVKLDKCAGSFTFLITYLIREYVNKTEDLNIHIFNMITGKNESKILTKDM